MILNLIVFQPVTGTSAERGEWGARRLTWPWSLSSSGKFNKMTDSGGNWRLQRILGFQNLSTHSLWISRSNTVNKEKKVYTFLMTSIEVNLKLTEKSDWLMSRRWWQSNRCESMMSWESWTLRKMSRVWGNHIRLFCSTTFQFEIVHCVPPVSDTPRQGSVQEDYWKGQDLQWPPCL